MLSLHHSSLLLSLSWMPVAFLRIFPALLLLYSGEGEANDLHDYSPLYVSSVLDRFLTVKAPSEKR